MKKRSLFGNIKELSLYLKQRGENLTPKNFSHENRLEIHHSDGSSFLFTKFILETAKLKNKKMNIDEDIFIVFTEHHGCFYYMNSDLVRKPNILKPL